MRPDKSVLKEIEKDGSVSAKVLFPEQEFLLEITPSDDKIDVVQWCGSNRKTINAALLEFGGVVFSGFPIRPIDFKAVAQEISPTPPIKYVGGVAKRPMLEDGVGLANTMDKRCVILQHHEMAYYRSWPMKIFFYCETPPTSGGETPVSSTRNFMKKISPDIVKQFAEREVMYTRNYLNEGVISSWQDSFNTNDKQMIEKICREMGVICEWRGESLHTKHVAQGIAIHPQTGESLWHNTAIRNYNCGKKGQITPYLRAVRPIFSEHQLSELLNTNHEDLPCNTYYGDGEFIESDAIEEISRVLENEKVSFSWKPGDLMVLDNMLAFHGRNAFEGDQRRILVMIKEELSAA